MPPAAEHSEHHGLYPPLSVLTGSAVRYHVSGQYRLRLVTHILRTERGDAAVVQVRRRRLGGACAARCAACCAAPSKPRASRLHALTLACLPFLQPYEPGETTRIALIDRLSGTNTLEASAAPGGGEEGEQELASFFDLYARHGDSVPPSLPSQVRGIYLKPAAPGPGRSSASRRLLIFRISSERALLC